MMCFQLFMDTHEDIQPICQYLKTRGWEDKSVKLLSAYDKCDKESLHTEFTFDSDDNDPFNIVMRPVDHPTELFKSLQQKDWGAALHCLHKKPTEAKTWIYRETDFPENKLLWKLLPLHAAVALGAPAYVVIELLHVYPDAAKQWDSKRSLPIHLAASRIDLDVDGERVLHHLLRVFPESAGVMNGRGRTPNELAYGAQLRKDRQIKRESKWESEEREPEEEGFELQLEMRDVMESFTNEVADWSLIDECLSSSCSYSDGSIEESGINLRESQFTESKSNSESNNSSSTGTESEESKSTVAVQSFDVKAISATRSISLRQSSDSSVSPTAKSFSSQNSAKSQPSQGQPKPEPSASVDSEMPAEKDTIGLTSKGSHESSRSNQAVAHAKSYELPPRPSMYSSPRISLPDPLPLLKSRSRSIEQTESIDRYSASNGTKTISESKADRSAKSVSASSQTSKKSVQKINHSFELPPKPTSSPLKSLPSPIRAFKQRSRSLRKSYSLDCASFEKSKANGFIAVDDNLSPNDYSTITVSTLSGQHEMICKQTNTFDCTPKQSMYKSPVRSLPLPSPLKMFKSRSRSLQKKASFDAYSFDKCSINDDINDEETLAQSTSPSNGTNQLSTSQEGPDDSAPSLGDIIKHVPSIASAKSYASHIDTADANNTNNMHFVPESARSTCTTFSVRTEVATPRNDGIDEDSSAVSTLETSPFEPDQVLADFVEEAISNIGKEYYTVKRVLVEMHEKKIDTVESLLALSPNKFLSLFSDRKLAIEMKRLLDDPSCRMNEASLLDSISEVDGSSSSSSSSSSGVIRGLL
ncbi:hypothetical protein ACHAXN_001236 [Cyclotella atomus]